MKITEAKADPNVKVVSTQKKVQVIATAKHPAGAGSVRTVPEHMVAHLLSKGMIVDPNGKK